MAHVTVYMTEADRVTVVPFLDHRNFSGQERPWCNVRLHDGQFSEVSLFVDDIGNTRQLIAALQDACDRIEAAKRKPDPLQIPMPLNADDMRPTTWGGPEGM